MPKPTRYSQETIEEYLKGGYWQSVTLADLWDRNGRDLPQKEAVADSKTRLSWGQAKQWIDRLALGLLESGMKRNEVLVIQLPNCVELCLLRVACEKAGILSLPALRTLRGAEMEYILSYTEAAGVVIPWQYRGFNYFDMLQQIRPRLSGLRHIFVTGDEVPPGTISIMELLRQPLEETYGSDYLAGKGYQSTEDSLLFLTTGTTGFPKFVVYPSCARLAYGGELVQVFKLTSEDVLAALAPASGGPNLPVYFAAPWVGAKIVLMERFEPEEALQLIERERVTVPGVVPAQLAMMAQVPNLSQYNLASVRAWFCTGSPLPYDVGKAVEEKIGGIVLNCYGAVDFGGLIIPDLDDPAQVHLATVGKPRAGTEVMLVDGKGQRVPKGEIGEVWGRGPSCASGYYKDPQATREAWTEDGWFETGDLGRWDEQGNLVIVGRKKDMIIRGGQNIYPVEIETLLLTHPKVREVAIVGMPDPLLGEKACAYVVVPPGEQITFEEMVSFLKEKRIAAYKLPERLEVVAKLPMVAEGQKIDKKALREDIIRKLKAAA